jgi:NAD(P)H-dependent FMN reductase
MPHIAIISGSVRLNRRSHRVALYFKNYIEENKLATAEILDLHKYNFPVFNERLKYQTSPQESTLDFAERFKKADGILLVTPEYNGGYPAAVKNAVDLLIDEWKRKPVAISTVSEGQFGGTQVITSLQFSLWKLKALTVPAMYPNPKVQDVFDEAGKPFKKEETDKRTAKFIEELLWVIDAKSLKDKEDR